MRTGHIVGSLTVAATLLALPGAALAQDMDAEGFDEDPVDTGYATVDFEAEAGVALPAGDLANFADPGVSLGLGGAFWLHDNVAIRADGDFANLNGERSGLVSEAATPDMSLYHYGLGVELDVPGRSSPSMWDFEVNAGVGGTTLDTETFLETSAADEDLTKTYPNVNAGLALGRQIAEDLTVNVRTQAFYTFVDEQEVEPISELRIREDLSRSVSVPLTLSVRWDLPSGGTSALGN